MRSRPSRPERDPESTPPARSRAPGPSLSERSASELYFRELADSHPLTRDGEVAIGRRIEDGELAVFEACVRENPKTPLARRCFQQLSDRVYLGFTGSAGTFIPEEELARLTELRGLAE